MCLPCMDRKTPRSPLPKITNSKYYVSSLKLWSLVEMTPNAYEQPESIAQTLDYQRNAKWWGNCSWHFPRIPFPFPGLSSWFPCHLQISASVYTELWPKGQESLPSPMRTLRNASLKQESEAGAHSLCPLAKTLKKLSPQWLYGFSKCPRNLVKEEGPVIHAWHSLLHRILLLQS